MEEEVKEWLDVWDDHCGSDLKRKLTRSAETVFRWNKGPFVSSAAGDARFKLAPAIAEMNGVLCNMFGSWEIAASIASPDLSQARFKT